MVGGSISSSEIFTLIGGNMANKIHVWWKVKQIKGRRRSKEKLCRKRIRLSSRKVSKLVLQEYFHERGTIH